MSIITLIACDRCGDRVRNDDPAVDAWSEPEDGDYAGGDLCPRCTPDESPPAQEAP